MYEGEAGDIVIAATGDCILTRPFSMFKEKPFLAVLDLLRKSDVAFTDLEAGIREDEGYPQYGPMKMHSKPAILEELKWAGINLVNAANNHSGDFGTDGVLATMKYLAQAKLAYAGIGRTLSEARMPGYLDTRKGRVALVGVDCTIPPMLDGIHRLGRLMAQHQTQDFKGSPGVNALRHSYTYTVDRQAFDEIRRISLQLGLDVKSRKKEYQKLNPNLYPVDSEKTFGFLGNRFILGDTFEIHSTPLAEDVDGNLRWLREARRMADWVMVYLHEHGPELPEFVRTYAHACIDAGADMVTGSNHRPMGIEIYKGKPIFYSLGTFALEMDTVGPMPRDEYSWYGVDPDLTSSHVFDALAYMQDPTYFVGVCAVTTFAKGAPKEIKLHPIECGFEASRGQRGRPMLASGDKAEGILAKVKKVSEPFGTTVVVKDGVGVITL